MVSGEERLLLHDRWPWLRDYSLAREASDCPTHAIPHAAAHAPADAAANATRYAWRTCGPIQLCG